MKIIILLSLVLATSLTYAVETTDSTTQTDISNGSIIARQKLNEIDSTSIDMTSVTCPRYIDFRTRNVEDELLRTIPYEVKDHWCAEGIKYVNQNNQYVLISGSDNGRRGGAGGGYFKDSFGILIVNGAFECQYAIFNPNTACFPDGRDKTKIITEGYTEYVSTINKGDIALIQLIKACEVSSVEIDPRSDANFEIREDNKDDCTVM